MNTELLRTFLEVARTRHFGRAAQNLFLTQSAISLRIKQLEDTFATSLFVRERGNLMLTPAGERLIPHAQNILAAWQLTLNEVAISNNNELQVALGASSNLWENFMRAMLPALAEHFENLFLRTEITSSQELVGGLLSGHLDLAVTLDPPGTSELEAQQIGAFELQLVSNHPHLTLSELETAGYIHVDWGTAFNLALARLLPKPAIPVLHTGQSQIALEFLLSHGGAAFLPSNVVQPHLQSGALHPVIDVESISREIYAVINLDANRLPQIRPIVDYLQHYSIQPLTCLPSAETTPDVTAP